MKAIEVLLNVNASRGAEIRPQLFQELNALHAVGIDLSTRKQEVQSGALSMNEAFAFILEHGKEIGSVIPLITAVLQLANTVVGRYDGKSKNTTKGEKDEPGQAPAIVDRVEGQEMPLPDTEEQIKRYVKRVPKGPKTPRAIADTPRSTSELRRAKKAVGKKK